MTGATEKPCTLLPRITPLLKLCQQIHRLDVQRLTKKVPHRSRLQDPGYGFVLHVAFAENCNATHSGSFEQVLHPSVNQSKGLQQRTEETRTSLPIFLTTYVASWATALFVARAPRRLSDLCLSRSWMSLSLNWRDMFWNSG